LGTCPKFPARKFQLKIRYLHFAFARWEKKSRLVHAQLPPP